jgi:hypothetical protein
MLDICEKRGAGKMFIYMTCMRATSFYFLVSFDVQQNISRIEYNYIMETYHDMQNQCHISKNEIALHNVFCQLEQDHSYLEHEMDEIDGLVNGSFRYIGIHLVLRYEQEQKKPNVSVLEAEVIVLKKLVKEWKGTEDPMYIEHISCLMDWYNYSVM